MKIPAYWILTVALLLGIFGLCPSALAQEDVHGEVIAGETGYEMLIQVVNPHNEPAEGVSVRLKNTSPIFANVTITPATLSEIPPGQTGSFNVQFDVAKEAKSQNLEKMEFSITAEKGMFDQPNPVVSLKISGTTQLIYRLVSIEPRFNLEHLHGFEHQANSSGYSKSNTHNGQTTTFSAKLTEFPREIVAGDPFEIAGEALQRVETVSGWPWCSSRKSPSSGSTMQLSAGTELMHSTGTFMGGQFKGRTDFTIYCSDGTKLRERRGLEHNAPIDAVKKEERMSFRIRYTPSGPPGDVESSLPTEDSNTQVTEKADPYSFFYSAKITSDTNTREIPGPEWLMFYNPDEKERERWKNWTAILMGDLRFVYKPVATAIEIADYEHPEGSNDEPARKEPEETGPSETEAQDPETPPGTSSTGAPGTASGPGSPGVPSTTASPGIPGTTSEPGSPGDPPSSPAEPIAPSNEGGGQTPSSPSESPSLGVPSTTAPPPGSDAKESEPNNSQETATAVGLPGFAEGRIDPKGEADWYQVHIDHQGFLQFSTSHVPRSVDLALQVWDSQKKVVKSWVTAPKTGHPLKGEVDLVSPGTYYLEVRDGHNNAASPEIYRLHVLFVPSKDTGEPNDTLETATPLSLEQSIQANILPRNDADWYRLEIPAQGALEVAITGMPPELDVTFQVWGANKKVVHGWRSVQKAGEDHVTGVDLPAPGTYYLEVRDGHNNARSSQPYTLRARLVLQSGQGIGIDRPGRDYRNFPVGSSNECHNACNAESKCQAWTYVKPGVQGASARCWLKHSVPGPVPNNCCTSGVK